MNAKSVTAEQIQIPLIRNETIQLYPSDFKVVLSIVIRKPSNRLFRVVKEVITGLISGWSLIEQCGGNNFRTEHTDKLKCLN